MHCTYIYIVLVQPNVRAMEFWRLVLTMCSMSSEGEQSAPRKSLEWGTALLCESQEAVFKACYVITVAVSI